MSVKLSIITPSLNQGEFIEENIQSVLNQNFNNFEHIIIDGGSDDNTIDILKKYDHLKWISEKDSGISNALNKGFSIAKGIIFGWLNADDYYEKNIFGLVVDEFQNNYDLVYGNLTFVDERKNIILKDKTLKYDLNNLINLSPEVRQPCTFFTKKIFYETGGLDEKFKIVFDLDLILKIIKHSEIKYINQNLAYYRDHSNTLTRRSVRKQALELFRVGRKFDNKLFSRYNKQVLRKIIYGKL